MKSSKQAKKKKPIRVQMPKANRQPNYNIFEYHQIRLEHFQIEAEKNNEIQNTELSLYSMC